MLTHTHTHTPTKEAPMCGENDSSPGLRLHLSPEGLKSPSLPGVSHRVGSPTEWLVRLVTEAQQS